jgi:hypothetical protein
MTGIEGRARRATVLSEQLGGVYLHARASDLPMNFAAEQPSLLVSDRFQRLFRATADLFAKTYQAAWFWLK